MRDETAYALKQFREALERLKEGVGAAQDDLDRDGVIQRFEFTFELLWKGLKVMMEEEGLECRTPKESLKAAFRLGFFKDEETALDMLEARNRMSHVYSKEEAQEVFHKIKDVFLPMLEGIAGSLSTWKTD